MRNDCSDRLTREGRDLSFAEAMDLYEGMIAEELTPDLLDDPEVEQQLVHDALAMRLAHHIACDIYLHTDGSEVMIAEALQANPDGYVQMIGEALETGDYGILAI